MELKFNIVGSDGEIEEIVRLADEIWHEHFAEILDRRQIDYMLDKFLSREALRRALRGGYEYFIVRDDRGTVGFIGVREEEGRLFLSKLYLRSAARGKGYASRMLGFLKDRFVAKGVREIYLTCNKYNENTLAVYRHWGFETTDSVVTDIGEGYVMDDYIMSLPLDGANTEKA